jgi:hypothetical protein
MKKLFTRIAVTAVAVTVLLIAYICRPSYLGSLSRLSHSVNNEQSSIALWLDAKPISQSSVSQLERIRWDFWIIAMPVRLEEPRVAGDLILVRAIATDRTDTEFLYVFDHQWHFIKVFGIPLA